LTPGQAAGLTGAFFLFMLAALFVPAREGSGFDKYRGLIALVSLGSSILSALVGMLLLLGCPAKPPPRPRLELLDPCPGGRPNPTKEFGCDFPEDST
jgi:hypothetical protein